MKKWLAGTAVLAAILALTLTSPLQSGQAGKGPVKVFILAGQSNMEGQGAIQAEIGRAHV